MAGWPILSQTYRARVGSRNDSYEITEFRLRGLISAGETAYIRSGSRYGRGKTMPNRFSPRFNELYAETSDIETSAFTVETSSFSTERFVDGERLKSWSVKTANLIGNACGKQSEHYQQWAASSPPGTANNKLSQFKRLRAILAAARDDYEGGHLTSFRSIVQAEVFSNELDQARELLGKEYKAPSAVIAGVVLETSLRELCDRSGITHGKLDKMNADLAKAGTYNLMWQKRITALAQIRNDAAHGHWDQFNEADVKGMIDDVERFLADQLN